jgi:hypothetical protein
MRDLARRFASPLLAAVLLGGLTTVTAEECAVPIRVFEAQGTMKFVDLAAGQITIDNRTYRLARNAVWCGADEEVSLQRQLLGAAGRDVGFVVDGSAKSPTVSAVWLLPAEVR